MTKDTLVLAHYYTTPEVQALADHVGDSLDLALTAQREQPKRIVFAGVRFMAETAKMIVPNAEVILPHADSTCSLVEQTNVKDIQAMIAKTKWLSQYRPEFGNVEVITYINSSVHLKAISDWIVTSRNVEDIIQSRIDAGKRVFFTPDRNMGAYLAYANPEWNENCGSAYNFDYYKDAVCEVHDKFKEKELDFAMGGWSDGPKRLIAHPESPLPVLKKADYVGSTHGMLKWITDYPYNSNTRAQIYVATEEGLLYNMREIRDDIDIIQAPIYSGCQCNACPYMKLNTVDLVKGAIAGLSGVKIDYMSDELIEQAHKPVNKMLEFK